MTKTYADLFTGGGGATIGAMAAGLTPLWGIEYDDEIASVARANLGDHVITADILDVDPSTLTPVDVLHASPPCPNFSVAKAGAEETENDFALAAKVVQFIETLQPKVFTLENVYGYRKSKSWAMIEDALHGAGYWVHMAHVNAADMGVPQTRKRMIVRAVRGGWVPYLPEPVRWVGWYEAIEDILHTLPDSQFANWQLERLPAELRETVMVGGANRSKQFAQFARENRPTMPGVKSAGKPSVLISATSSTDLRAFLMSNDPHTASGADSHRFDDKPAWTLGATNGPKMRAWLFGNNANDTSGASIAVDGDSPAQTVRTGSGGRLQRAVVFDDDLDRYVYGDPEPFPGRVVSMTPRALARFQSFPDWYELPDKKTLAARIIGNAVPPLLYQRIIGGILE